MPTENSVQAQPQAVSNLSPEEAQEKADARHEAEHEAEHEAIQESELDYLKRIGEEARNNMASAQVIAGSISLGATTAVNRISAQLNDILDTIEHARSVVPGAPNPGDKAMEIMGKIERITRDMQGDSVLKLMSESLSAVRISEYALHSTVQSSSHVLVVAQQANSLLRKAQGVNERLDAIVNAQNIMSEHLAAIGAQVGYDPSEVENQLKSDSEIMAEPEKEGPQQPDPTATAEDPPDKSGDKQPASSPGG